MPALQWFKSSYSTNNGACVEVAFTERRVAARDSKNPDGPMVSFGVAEWSAFLNARQAPSKRSW